MALRQRLTTPAAAKGLSLPVLPLAAEFGVSSTPVREALAHLAGEGLVVRSGSGYRAKTYDRGSLAALYDLAGLLVEAALAKGLDADEADRDPTRGLERLQDRVSNRALAAAISRVMWQLTPYLAAERHVLGEDEGHAFEGVLLHGVWGPGPAGVVRAYFRRRTQRAGEILASTMGLR